VDADRQTVRPREEELPRAGGEVVADPAGVRARIAGHGRPRHEEDGGRGLRPALSYDPKLDRGFRTVYYELDSMVSLPMVPILLNYATTTPPLMTLRHAYDFGTAVGDAIRSFDGLERVAVIAGGGLSHHVGEPRVGDVGEVGEVGEEFDRWFLRRLESQDYDELFALPDDELMEAGNGTGEVRAWMAVAGAMREAKAEVLADEPIYPWTNGTGVVLFDRATD
jgi:Catalytic LigB subunit of aromatic ring-opening dioxygenase